jgi:subtilisin family serine protease
MERLWRNSQAVSALGALACSCVLSVVPAQAATGEHHLVKFRAGATPAEREAALADAEVELVRTIEGLDVQVVRALSEDAKAVLAASWHVAYVEQDVVARLAETVPNDAAWTDQWGIRKVGGPQAWDSSRGSPAVVVAVLDTGIDFLHPDVRALIPGFDFVNRDHDPSDDHGHGTAAAGVVSALTNNVQGIAGACWHCSLMALKVLDANGVGAHSTIAEAIVWAADHGARTVNLSLGSSGTTRTLGDAVAYAVGKGVVLVAAAGNESSSTPFYPAAYPGVISVAGSDAGDRPYPWSNFGSWVKVAAPGCNRTTARGGGYTTFCGTSSAAPMVSGLAGLALAAQPLATPIEIEHALMRSAVPMPGFVSYGRVNAAAFLSELGGVTPLAPASTSIDPSRPFQRAREFTVSWDAPGGTFFDVRYRRARAKGAFDAYVIWQAGTTSTQAAFRSSPGSTYCFSTSARDGSEVPRPWGAESCTAIPLDEGIFKRRGPWKRKVDAGSYLADYVVSGKRGASLVAAGLEARVLVLVATRCRGCGTVEVLWNGRRLRRINLGSRRLARTQLIPIASFEDVRRGRVQVRVTSSRRPVRIEGLGVSRS